MKLSPALKRAAAAAFVAAAVAFLGWTILRNWSQLRTFDWRLEPLPLVLSVAAQVATLAWGVWVWRLVIARFGQAPPRYPALLRIWSLSNAARYIPGTVWQFFAAAQLAADQGLSRVTMLASLAVHLGLVLLSAAVISLATLPLRDLGLGVLPQEALWALPLLLVFVHPRVINGALALLERVSRRPVVRWRGSWWDGVWLLALEGLSWGLYGVAFWLFLRSIAAFPPETLLPATGINAASFIAGWIVVIAPGGAGFREAAMSGLLTAYVPVGVAAAISVLSRLWTIVAEILVAVIAVVISRREPGLGAEEGAEVAGAGTTRD